MFGADEDEETVYGTPLPPLEEAENASKKPDLDLTVRDSKGRRRFHGAFTGGFSAGYFNTVGTEKGWIPSQYVSKKDQRWDKKLVANRPEDFMDEEDFSLFGIAPKKVHTKENFKGPEPDSFAGFRDSNASMIDVLREIIKPATQSIGVRLFTAMKKGRRYKGAFTMRKDNTRIYGCSLPPGFDIGPVTGDENDSYEPEISPVIFSLPYKPKINFHGIGYSPLQSGSSIEEEGAVPLTALLSGNKRLKITGEAFGYGPLEDDDDNAEDALVYSKVDLSKYDFEIGSVKRKTSRPSTSAVLSSTGKGSLEGFTKAVRAVPSSSSRSKLPEIPRNWKPTPPFMKAKKSSRWNQLPGTSSQDHSSDSVPSRPATAHDNYKTAPLNANSRAVVLGEEVDIVVGIKKKPTEAQKVASTSDESVNDRLSKPAKTSLNAFLVSKFVRSSDLTEEKFGAGLTETKDIPLQMPKSLTEEKVDDKPRVGLIARETFQWHPHSLLCKRFNVPHPFPQFPDVVGVLNIKGIEKGLEKTKTLSASASRPNIFSGLFEAPTSSATSSSIKIDDPEKVIAQSDIQTTSSISWPPETDQSIERPPIDIFKAIFASDESQSESDEEENKKIAEPIDVVQTGPNLVNNSDKKDDQSTSTVVKETLTREQIVQPSTSRTGIFSGIDLDLLNRKISYKIDPKPDEIKKPGNKRVESEPSIALDGRVRETSKPTRPGKDSVFKVLESEDSGLKKKDKKRKKSKSKSRHKSKKSKSKHKGKKSKKRKRYSSESESSSDDSSNDSNDSAEINAKLIQLIELDSSKRKR